MWVNVSQEMEVIFHVILGGCSALTEMIISSLSQLFFFHMFEPTTKPLFHWTHSTYIFLHMMFLYTTNKLARGTKFAQTYHWLFNNWWLRAHDKLWNVLFTGGASSNICVRTSTVFLPLFGHILEYLWWRCTEPSLNFIWSVSTKCPLYSDSSVKTGCKILQFPEHKHKKHFYSTFDSMPK